MKTTIFKILFLIFSLSIVLNAKDNSIIFDSKNDVYFLPSQSEAVEEKIVDLIKGSNNSIYIAMYNFSYKKFAKELIKASKKGIKITVILDKSKVEKDDEIYKILKKNDIKIIIPNIKLHTKLALFDSKKLVLGSSNWTKESFKKNYEIILFTNDQKVIKKTKKFLDEL